MKNSNSTSPQGQQAIEYYRQKWSQANVQLEEGEVAVQEKDAPFYFTTTHGRTFSVYGKKCRELKQFPCKTGKANRGTNKYLHTYLWINGKKRAYNSAKLLQKNFRISEFNPTGSDEKLVCHHIQTYDEAKGRLNNFIEGLQITLESIHKRIFTPLQNATLTEEGMKLKNPKQFEKQLAKLGAETKVPLAIMAEVDRATGKVTSVHGEDLSGKTLHFRDEAALNQFLMNTPSLGWKVMQWYIENKPELVRVKGNQIYVVEE